MESREISAPPSLTRVSTAAIDAPMLRAELRMHEAEAEAALFGMPSVGVGTATRVPHAPGLELGRFLLQRKLGEGGMGAVYQAYDAKLNRSVAIKLALVRGGSSEAAHESERLMREATALAQLSHPNVVHVYEVGTAAGQVFIVMELVSGRSLRSWLGDAPRRRAEVLDVFDQAARGLVAAHEAGIVHRDFKLDNVVVGKDGRARVVDFGLAAADSGASDSIVSSEQVSVADSGGRLPITAASRTISGTPPYMAPEQHRGDRVDARSDQYSFCVALFEALYGARPFPGRELDALLGAKLEARVQVPEDAPRVPAYLLRALMRGLSAEPQERFGSMGELREVLGDDPARRRRWLVGGGAVLVGGLATFGLVTPERPCIGAETQMEQVWSPERREGLRTVLQGADRPDAEEVGAEVDSRLDDYARAWTEGYVGACLAHDRGEHSDELYDRRVACLERRRDALDQTVDVLVPGGPRVLEHAARMSLELPSIDACADLEALTAQVAPPEDPADREQVAWLRQKVARMIAYEQSERYQEAIELGEEVLVSAQDLGYGPVEAEAMVMKGSLQRQLGSYEDAERSLGDGFLLALGAGHDEQAVNAARLLVFVLSEHFHRYEDAARWGELMTALVRRSEVPRRLRASVHMSMGELHGGKRRFERALEELHAGLAIYEEIRPDDHPDIAHALENISHVLQEQGDLEGARGLLLRAKGIYERTLGPASLAVAKEELSLAYLAIDEEDWDEARRWFLESRQGFLDGFGPDHRFLPYVDRGLGRIEQRLGNYEAAAAHYEDALEAARAQLGERASLVLVLQSQLADLALLRARYDVARPILERLVRHFEEHGDPGDVEHAYTVLRQGRVAELLGEPDVAEATLRHAYEVAQLDDDPMPDLLAAIELAQARLARHGGELERCAELVDRAAANLDRTAPVRRVTMTAELAVERAALWLERGEHARVREHLEPVLVQDVSMLNAEDLAEAQWVLARARAGTIEWDEEVDRLATAAEQRLRDAKLPERAEAVAQWRAAARP